MNWTNFSLPGMVGSVYRTLLEFYYLLTPLYINKRVNRSSFRCIFLQFFVLFDYYKICIVPGVVQKDFLLHVWERCDQQLKDYLWHYEELVHTQGIGSRIALYNSLLFSSCIVSLAKIDSVDI